MNEEHAKQIARDWLHRNADLAETLETSLAKLLMAMVQSTYWENMSPAQIWNALVTAPKIAGPWTWLELVAGPSRWYRYDAYGHSLVCSMDEHGKADVDRQLREAGYLLVD